MALHLVLLSPVFETHFVIMKSLCVGKICLIQWFPTIFLLIPICYKIMSCYCVGARCLYSDSAGG